MRGVGAPSRWSRVGDEVGPGGGTAGEGQMARGGDGSDGEDPGDV